MSVKNSIKAIPMAAISSTVLTASFQPINVGGLPNACFLLKFNNFTTAFVVISLDGITDHDTIDFGASAEVYGGIGSSQPQNETCLWTKGQVFYVRGTAGTGVFSLSGYYQPQGD